MPSQIVNRKWENDEKEKERTVNPQREEWRRGGGGERGGGSHAKSILKLVQLFECHSDSSTDVNMLCVCFEGLGIPSL